MKWGLVTVYWSVLDTAHGSSSFLRTSRADLPSGKAHKEYLPRRGLLRLLGFLWPEMMCSKFNPADDPLPSGSKASKPGASFWLNKESTPLRIGSDWELSRNTAWRLPSVIDKVSTGE